MKIGNWCKKLSATLVAAGIFVPSISHAANIPLDDPSFEDYVLPGNFAYAPAYRPTSAWIDDQDSPGTGYVQDNAHSNWLYSASYAEAHATSKRPSPRTENQAMHGVRAGGVLGHYSTQVTAAVFEAGKTYTFSIWAQGDADAITAPGSAGTSRVWLYIYDGSLAFSEANSLIFARYAPDTGDFLNRGPNVTAEESKEKWRQISLSFDAVAEGSYLGKPIGVGFWVAEDGAVDDATLTVTNTIPEPASIILVGLGGVALLALRRKL